MFACRYLPTSVPGGLDLSSPSKQALLIGRTQAVGSFGPEATPGFAQCKRRDPTGH